MTEKPPLSDKPRTPWLVEPNDECPECAKRSIENREYKRDAEYWFAFALCVFMMWADWRNETATMVLNLLGSFGVMYLVGSSWIQEYKSWRARSKR